MITTDDFWVAVAFVIFIAISAKLIWPRIIAALDGRRERIKSEIEEAARLREDAQRALAEYKKQQRDAAEEAEQILTQAREDAARLRAKAQSELEEVLAKRREKALEKIARAEADAVQEIRSRASQLAVSAAAELISENLSEERSRAIVDSSIEQVARKLN